MRERFKSDHNQEDIRKMFRCEICEKTFKNKSGLGGHVTSVHEISWADYKNEYTVVELPKDKGKIRVEADEEDEASEARSRLKDRLERMEAIMNRFMSGYSPSGEPSGIYDFPGEEIEITGEKLNYKIALNPAIFSWYDKFKAVVLRRGMKKWTGDFADFIDISTKDILAVYGIYDTVVEFRDGRILFEFPEELSEIG